MYNDERRRVGTRKNWMLVFPNRFPRRRVGTRKTGRFGNQKTLFTAILIRKRFQANMNNIDSDGNR